MGIAVLGLDVSVGEAVMAGHLQLFPLFGCDGNGLSYVTGVRAMATDVAAIHEDETGASVGELVVDVSGAYPVLLVEGETLLGAKQNRTLNITVLCPSNARTVLPVSCVEQGRWGEEQPVYRSDRHASAKLRSIKTSGISTDRGSVQGEVWAEVSRKVEEFQVDSPTEALEDAFEAADRKVDDQLADLQPAAGQTGMCACAGGKVLALDIFDQESTLDEYFRSLVAGYALDAVVESELHCDVEEVERFLEQVAKADVGAVPATGLGEELHIAAPELSAHGLRVGRVLVHLAAFPVPAGG